MAKSKAFYSAGLILAVLLVGVSEQAAASSVTVYNCGLSFDNSTASGTCEEPTVSVSNNECTVSARCQRVSANCSNPDRCTRWSSVTGSRDDIGSLKNCDGILTVENC